MYSVLLLYSTCSANTANPKNALQIQDRTLIEGYHDLIVVFLLYFEISYHNIKAANKESHDFHLYSVCFTMYFYH